VKTSEELSVTNENEYYFTNTVTLENTDIENNILQLINTYRLSIGLNTLEINTSIKIQTEQHSLYMANESEMSHDLFYIRKSNLENTISASHIKENVAYGYATAQSVLNAWLNSDSHKAVIEDVNFSYFNISAQKNDQEIYYFTLICTND
jgi:uncharacterized protein YkwD